MRLRKKDRNIVILAGPNGAGKTTFAQDFLTTRELIHFINADLIARGLSPFALEHAAFDAGKIVLKRMDQYASSGESFAFETLEWQGIRAAHPAMAQRGI
jgi:predicted ABC-type ATPase